MDRNNPVIFNLHTNQYRIIDCIILSIDLPMMIEFTDKKYEEIRKSGIDYHISYHPITFIPRIILH